MKDVTVYLHAFQDKWIFFKESRPSGFQTFHVREVPDDVTFHVREVPDDVTDEQVAEMANNRKEFIYKKTFLLAPVTGSLTATATETGTATWEELRNAK